MNILTNLQNTVVIAHEVNDSMVEQRQQDGYINATALAKAYKQSSGKRRDVNEWLSNKRTLETLSHLSSKTGIPVIELYQVFQGSPENSGGTWIHPRLAVRFGIWLSDEFGYMVEEWVEQWLTLQNPLIAELNTRVTDIEQKWVEATSVIATLQSQIQSLLPTNADFMPPGWSQENWNQLPSQDKRHFRYLWKRRKFRPSNQGETEPLALAVSTEAMKQRQRDEVTQIIGETSQEEADRIAAAKEEMLRKFWEEQE